MQRELNYKDTISLILPAGITMATQISTSSSKYKNLISKSSLLRSGSPAVYQLRPQEQKFGTLTRKTVGEKNQKKTNKTILLVGESGAGKSTLINSLFNYTIGVKFDHNIWFETVEKENRSQTESQTSDVIVYEIFGFEGETLPYSLTIIDTPGFGDTRGIEHDVTISQRLLDLFRSEDGVHELNAVGLVMKATDNRLSDRLMYVFNSVTSLFGKDLENKIVALITHSDGRKPQNALQALETAKIICARNEKNQPVHFVFNNCQNEERTEEDDFGLDTAWRVTDRGMNQFTNFLEQCEPQRLTKTVKVLNLHIRLTACIQNLQDRIKLIELKQTEIKQTQEALKKHEEEMKENEKFTIEVNEVYKDKEPIDGGMWLGFYEAAVTCFVCEENCHYPGCTVAWSPKSCEVMKGGHCTSCSGKCPVSDHVKEKWIYVTKTVKVKKTLQDVKYKYEKNLSQREMKMSLLETLGREMRNLTAVKNQLLDEAYQHVVSLEQIALNVASVSTYVHLDFLIQGMKEKGDTEKVRKLEEMERRVDKRTKGALEYMWGKLTVAGEAVKGVFTKVSKKPDQSSV
uniref:Septin-type G domain-containing protein n=1 Tax=Mastacembelus armatus TaxID=205130 RepID=A0A3Q3M3C5_9TELE